MGRVKEFLQRLFLRRRFALKTPLGVPQAPKYKTHEIPAVKPKKSCRRCHGAGYTGWKKSKDGLRKKIACRCVMKQIPLGYQGDVRLDRGDS